MEKNSWQIAACSRQRSEVGDQKTAGRELEVGGALRSRLEANDRGQKTDDRG